MARLLLDMLPPELAEIGSPEERAAEYLDYRQFFIAWETLNGWQSPKRSSAAGER